MKASKGSSCGIAAVALAALAVAVPSRLVAQQTGASSVLVGDSELAARSPVQTDRKQACGLSPRRPIFPLSSPGSS
jgi:hypothetical protein